MNRSLLIAVAAALLVLAPIASAGRLSPPDPRFRVVTAVVVSVAGKERLLLRVNGPTRTVRVRIVLARASGHVIVAVVRAIRTNRRLLVQRLVIPAAARRIHVRILGHVG